MIEIKKTSHHDMDDSISKIKPENIILLRITRDQFYDGPSSDLGWFYDIIHKDGDDILWDWYNPFFFDRSEPISWLADSDYLEKRGSIRINKKNRNDFKIVDGKIVFKNKYVLELDDDNLFPLEKEVEKALNEEK